MRNFIIGCILIISVIVLSGCVTQQRSVPRHGCTVYNPCYVNAMPKLNYNHRHGRDYMHNHKYNKNRSHSHSYIKHRH